MFTVTETKGATDVVQVSACGCLSSSVWLGYYVGLRPPQEGTEVATASGEESFQLHGGNTPSYTTLENKQ